MQHPTVIFLVCTTIVLVYGSTHACIHDTYVLGHKDDSLYTKIHQLYTSDTITTSSYIRILLDISSLDIDEGYSCYHKGETINVDGDPFTCSNDDILTGEKKSFLKNDLLPAANARLSAIFKVVPTQGPLYLNDVRCGFQGGVAIPRQYTRQGDGIAADIVVFVTSRPIATAHVLAFGGQCQEDQYGRPIAGHLNFSPSRINVNPSSRDAQLGIILHELTHVLGFSYGKFGRFHSPTRGLISGYTTITDHARAHDETAQITVVNTPRVVEWLQNHFDCASLSGAPLEDGGGAGTRLSHWEKRVFMNEYMTGESTNNPVLSGLTMALFEDSGWYEIDYTTAEDLIWGRNEGCGFVQDTCEKWPRDRGYYCSEENQPSCSFDLQTKGHCGVTKHSTALPTSAQYFSDPLLGGNSELADYCPYTVASSGGWCFDEANAALPSIVNNGETFCPNCKCFASSLVKELPIAGDVRLSCYETACSNATSLKVRINSLWYDCPPETDITVEGYGGKITCPREEQIFGICVDAPWVVWPTIRSFSPTSGSTGTRVTIYGSGFGNTTQVVIHNQCKDIQIVSSEEIIAVVPAPDGFGNPAHILAESVDVIVIVDGRTAERLGAFTLSATGENTTVPFVVVVMAWCVQHWLVCITVIFALASAGMFWYKRHRKLPPRKQYVLVPLSHSGSFDV